MDLTALQLIVTGLSAASAKPVWDYLSGKTAAKRATEDKLWEKIEKLEKANEKLEKANDVIHERLDKAKARISQMASEAALERRNWERQLGEVQDLLSDVQANNEALTIDLRITVEHVAALQDQLKALDQVPAPRPEQPRNPNGTFASPSSAPVARKGKK